MHLLHHKIKCAYTLPLCEQGFQACHCLWWVVVDGEWESCPEPAAVLLRCCTKMGDRLKDKPTNQVM